MIGGASWTWWVGFHAVVVLLLVVDAALPGHSGSSRLAQRIAWLWTAALSAVAVTWVYRTFFDLTLARVIGILPWLLALGAIALVCVALAEASAPPGRVASTARYVAAIEGKRGYD